VCPAKVARSEGPRSEGPRCDQRVNSDPVPRMILGDVLCRVDQATSIGMSEKSSVGPFVAGGPYSL